MRGRRLLLARSVSVHGLQSKRVAPQMYHSYLLSSRCCSILSDFKTATRCSSAFRIDKSPEPLPTSAFHVCGYWLLLAKRPSPTSRRSLPPGSARLDIQPQSLNTYLRSSFIGRRDCVPASSGTWRFSKVIKTFSRSSSWCFVVKSLTLL